VKILIVTPSYTESTQDVVKRMSLPSGGMCGHLFDPPSTVCDEDGVGGPRRRLRNTTVNVGCGSLLPRFGDKAFAQLRDLITTISRLIQNQLPAVLMVDSLNGLALVASRSITRRSLAAACSSMGAIPLSND
jgi:hypothetical protein